LLWSLAMLAGLAGLAVMNEEAREVIFTAIGYILGTLNTPFILEASFFLLGILIVLTVNNLRLEREGDGWVEMEITPEPPEPQTRQTRPGAHTQRSETAADS
jgi:hypothetical protein